MSSPKKRIVPDVGRKSPVTQLNKVVLPAPLEPSTARRSPGLTVMVTSVSAASAPNMRVTPRSSSAAAEPSAERRSATLSMAVPPRTRPRLLGFAAPAPALIQSDDAVGRPEHDGQEAEPDQQPEAIAVEPELDQEIQREGAQDDEVEGADERPDRTRDAADHRHDENVDTAFDGHGARRDLPVVPDLEHAAEARDQRRERIGSDPVRIDVEAERRHAPGI